MHFLKEHKGKEGSFCSYLLNIHGWKKKKKKEEANHKEEKYLLRSPKLGLIGSDAKKRNRDFVEKT